VAPSPYISAVSTRVIPKSIPARSAAMSCFRRRANDVGPVKDRMANACPDPLSRL
jgi:hypothetical protein